jgi:hypothetical protein
MRKLRRNKTGLHKISCALCVSNAQKNHAEKGTMRSQKNHAMKVVSMRKNHAAESRDAPATFSKTITSEE